MTRRNPGVKEVRRKVSAHRHQGILVPHCRILNPPVLGNCVIDAESLTLKNMRLSAKPKQPSAMVLERLVITRSVVKRLETFPRSHITLTRCISQVLQNRSTMMRRETRVTVSSQHMLSVKNPKPQQELLAQFSIGKNFHSIDKRVTLKFDTGADVNAFNRKTFYELFPDVQLQPSTVILENFDKSMMKPTGTFKCFLHWKGKVYRIQAEVMDSDDTPNVLSWETTFLMGILKPCFVAKKVDRIPEKKAPQLPEIPVVTDHSNDSKKPAKSINPDSLKNQPLTQQMIESTYSDVFEGLGKFPGEPYKLRLKENSVPAKHHLRKVPVHLQDAFHEKVRRLVKIDVLEPVTEQTEWVNSYVIVEKEAEINTANTHSPHHTIKKKIRLCIEPQGSEQLTGVRTILFKIHRWAHCQVQRSCDFWHGQRLLAGGTTSRLKEIYLYGIRHWTSPIQMLTHGDSSCQWHIPKEVRLSLHRTYQESLESQMTWSSMGKPSWSMTRIYSNSLRLTRKNGLVLNKSKLQFKKQEVHFFGHRWNSQGITPDPKKIDSILKIEFPKDKETMHSYLGLINFLNRYSPQFGRTVYTTKKSHPQGRAHYNVTEEHLSCIRRTEEWVQEDHSPALLQQIQGYDTANWCKQEGLWCSSSSRQSSSVLCL